MHVSSQKKIINEVFALEISQKTHMSFKLNDIELITRLIGQKYPDKQSYFHNPLSTLDLKTNMNNIHQSLKLFRR